MSDATVPEPDCEQVSAVNTPRPEGARPGSLTFPNAQDVQQELDQLDETAQAVAQEAMTQSVMRNNVLDGLPENYGAARGSVARRWERRHDRPYFSESF